MRSRRLWNYDEGKNSVRDLGVDQEGVRVKRVPADFRACLDHGSAEQLARNRIPKELSFAAAQLCGSAHRSAHLFPVICDIASVARISIWIKEKRKKERGKVEQNFDGLVRGVGRIAQGDDWRKKKKKKQETKIL
ncbi:hypothetical protein RB195_015232 [Necator americanus]